MTVKREDGTTIDTADDVAKTPWSPDDPVYVMDERTYREVTVPGGGATFRYLLWAPGDRKRQSEIDAAFTDNLTYPAGQRGGWHWHGH